MTVEAIARQWRFSAERSRFSGRAREGEVETPQGPVRTLVLKPETFYNESGRSIRSAMDFYKASPGDIVVFYDEIDLALGRFRMKIGGGGGGITVIRSTIAHIGPDFRRARMGTGHPGHKDRVLSHVLSDFQKSERPAVQAMIEACASALPLLAIGEDARYQAEVMRLAPAEKLDPRGAA
jgi:PTH1 family peptidyl-tRNA hydrolase